MTETLLRIQLNELSIVRVICRKGDCGGIIEVPIDRLNRLTRQGTRCPICNEELIPLQKMPQVDPLPELGRLLRVILDDLSRDIALEFTLPLATAEQSALQR